MAKELVIRRAVEEDVRKVFELSNDPVVRANSIHTEQIAWESHVAWFSRMLANEDVVFLIVETPGKDFVGQVRLVRLDEKWEISISIAAPFRGKGLSSEILLRSVEIVGLRKTCAFVAAENTASRKLFESCGYREIPERQLVVGARRFIRYEVRS